MTRHHQTRLVPKREKDYGGETRVLVVVRGDSPEIARFATGIRPTVEGVAWRKLVWLRDRSRTIQEIQAEWIQEDQSADTVLVINIEQKSVVSIPINSSRYEIEVALLDALRADSIRRSSSQASVPAKAAGRAHGLFIDRP